MNFGVSFGYIGSNSTFSGSTTIGGNLSVLQGSGTNDEVNFGVNFTTLFTRRRFRVRPRSAAT